MVATGNAISGHEKAIGDRGSMTKRTRNWILIAVSVAIILAVGALGKKNEPVSGGSAPDGGLVRDTD